MDTTTTTTLISNFTKTLASFCNHLDSTSTALKQSLERRPIPLDSASSTFIQCLNRRVSSASSDLNLLESMACGTVSFEELLGHCNQLYLKNQSDLEEIVDRLQDFGYTPIDDEEEVVELGTPVGLRSVDVLDLCAPVSASVGFRSVADRKLDDDDLLDESLSLQNLGLSDVCLATIASDGNDEIENITSSQKHSNYTDGRVLGREVPYQPMPSLLDMTQEDVSNDPELVVVTKKMINISKADYENLPSFMKSLASWQDMVVAVEKMNSYLNTKNKSTECNLFYQEELSSLGLGPKVRSYLLMLLRMNQLVVETVNGSIAYRVL